MPARFEGEVHTEWMKHDGPDRKMRLLEDFKFIDDDGKEWLAPKGHIIDGATIPEVFWAVAGSPFVGDYRRATVVHDVYCDTKSEPHKAVHRMIYDAMRTDGVAKAKAKRMYTAIRLFGPKWPGPSAEAQSIDAPSIEAIEAALDVALGE